jgi:hypothetical protein
MTNPCLWPEGGACACYMAEANKPSDPYGRVWMHCEEGLNFSKASMARFMMFCLGNNVEIGSINAFAPDHPRCQVSASIRIKPTQIAAFESETGGKLRKPAKLVLS